MPLVGGGGAANTAGGTNPAGTGSGLNYIGEHVYANSGGIAATNANDTLLDFTTGGEAYIVAEIQIGSETGSGDDFRYSILFNGEAIMDNYANNTYQTNPNFGYPMRLIIPGQTRVQVKADNLSVSTARTTYATLTGRVYA